jgi:hypothetical protein
MVRGRDYSSKMPKHVAQTLVLQQVRSCIRMAMPKNKRKRMPKAILQTA